MHTPSRTLDARLDAAHRAIHGALTNPDVLALVSTRSFDREALEAGAALHAEVRTLNGQAHERRADQYGATGELEKQRKALRSAYTLDLGLARAEFPEDRQWSARLGLTGTRARSFAAWIAQARAFYEAVSDDEAARRLAPLGLCKKTAKTRLEALATLESLRLRQAGARGDAQELTRRRREAHAALDAWMRRYLAAARAALHDQPQLIEKLGITAKA